MECTCGLYVVSKNKLLIVHPTSAPDNTWSIPKGLNEKGEEHLESAFRELKEETGLVLDENSGIIKDLGFQKYKRRKAKVLHGFLLTTDIDLTNEPLVCTSYFSPKDQGLFLMIPEVDRFKWINIDSEDFNMLHQTQIQLFNLNMVENGE